jgi:hypothetical protein
MDSGESYGQLMADSCGDVEDEEAADDGSLSSSSDSNHRHVAAAVPPAPGSLGTSKPRLWGRTWAAYLRYRQSAAPQAPEDGGETMPADCPTPYENLITSKESAHNDICS